MTPTLQHQERAAVMARECAHKFYEPSGYPAIPFETKDSAKLALQKQIVTTLNLPQLIADQAECERLRKVEHCEHCGSDKIYHGPPDCLCGAPSCCQACCKITTLEEERDKLRAELSQLRRNVGSLYEWFQGNTTITGHQKDAANAIFDSLEKGLREDKEIEKLRAERDELQHPRIYSRCPACGNDTLTLNKGNLLCTWHECKNPTVMNWVGTPEWQKLFADSVNKELETLRTREAALMGVARAAYNEHSRTGDDFHSGNKIVEHGYFMLLEQALTAAIQSGIKL